MGGDVAGVYKTEDHGEHWRFVNNGLGDYAVFTLAADSLHPDTLYAATPSGLSKSTDAGEHWTVLGETRTQKIAADKGKSVHSVFALGDRVWAGTPDGRIAQSADGGQTWRIVHTLQGEGACVFSMAGSGAGSSSGNAAGNAPAAAAGNAAASRAVLLAATGQGILRSEDGGATWSVVSATPAHAVALSADGAVAFAALGKAGVARSGDGGRTWAAAGTGIAADCETWDVALDPANPARAYCIGSAGWNGDAYYSEDGGASWTRSRSVVRDIAAGPTLPDDPVDSATGGAPLSDPRNLAVNPRAGNELFIAANWRPVQSGDGGRTLRERDRGADISCVQDLCFAAGKTYAVAMDEGAMVSADDGATWTQLWPRKYSKAVSGHQWRIHVWDGGNRILASCSPWDEPLNGVLVSGDAGKTFDFVRAGLPTYLPKADTMWGRAYPRALAADPSTSGTFYLGMDGDPGADGPGGGLFKSTDGGRTWQQLAAQPGSRRMFFGLAVDPTEPRRLYWGASGTQGGLWRSDDAGGSWRRVFTNETWVFNVVVGPSGMVLCPGGNLWRSRDHGDTWEKLTDRGAGGGTIVGLAVDPRDENRIWYADTTWGSGAEGGIFETRDGGKTWDDITGDIGYRKPLVLRYNADTKDLWAAGAGIFKMRR
jgi:photosystem II stability/assembly factor-like uncharacterized protein